MKNGFLWLIVIALVFVLSWFAGNKLQDQAGVSFQPITKISCEPAGLRCNTQFSDITLQLEFNAPPVVMLPFVMTIATHEDVEEIILQFRMKDMDMGMQRYSLVNVGTGLWQAEVILPVCSLGRSDWTAVMDVNYQSRWWRGEFDFTAASQ